MGKSARHRRSKKQPSIEQDPPPTAKTNAPVKKKKKTKSKGSRDNSKESPSVEGVQGSKNRMEWAKNASQMKCRELSKAFIDCVRTYRAPDRAITSSESNPEKNRYRDVWCLDETRVVLKNNPGGDYIHANWVRIPTGRDYICTQAPLDETIEDFWHMVVQELAAVIGMLCEFKESTIQTQGVFEKSAIYFPRSSGEKLSFGPYDITNTGFCDDLSAHDGFKISNLLIHHKGKEIHSTKHVMMTSWPDQLAPIEAAPVLALWEWLKKNSLRRPIIVHCSAGVGRTSTLVGIELADYRIAQKSSTTIVEIVKELRTYRYQSVQSHIQFLYIHVVLLEHYLSKKIISKDGVEMKFIEEYRKHVKKKLDKQAAGAAAAKESADD